MVYIKGAASEREQVKKPGPVYTGAAGIGKVFHSQPATSMPDAPIPFKSPRTSVLLDAETIRQMTDKRVHQAESSRCISDMERIPDKNEDFLHLNRPLLVRLKLLRNAGDVVKAVCDSRDIRRKGLKLSLPCSLDLRTGCILNMEVFLNYGEAPVGIRGEVRRVARRSSEDLIRYEVDVDFDPMNTTALSRIDGFIQASEKTQNYQHLPA